METGIVKFFKINERGGFGFLTLESGEEIYFQRNDGGPVVAGKDGPVIQAWQSIRQPRVGDWINFERCTYGCGKTKAAPWCYHTEWNAALHSIEQRPTYRLMEQQGSRFQGKKRPVCLWEGSYLRDLSKEYPRGISLTASYKGDDWSLMWFEIQTTEGEWQRVDYDPLVSPPAVTRPVAVATPVPSSPATFTA